MRTAETHSIHGRSIAVVMARAPVPVDDGWCQRSYSLLEALVNGGATVDLFCANQLEQHALGELPKIRRFVSGGRSTGYHVGDLLKGVLGRRAFSVVNYDRSSVRQSFYQAGHRESYDLLLIEDVVMAQYRDVFRARRCILDMHNVESNLLMQYAAAEPSFVRALYARLTAEKLARYEAVCTSTFDLTTVCSWADEKRLRDIGAVGRLAVLPNGVDVDGKRQLAGDGNGSVLFVGTLSYHANVIAAEHWCGNILPLVRRDLPGLQTKIVGKDPSARVRSLGGDDVEVVGQVPDVRPYFEAASVVIVPLLSGGGTRLKILEAMSFGRAVVSTSVGCEGLEVRDGEHLLIADNPEDFSRAVTTLITDVQLRRRLQKAAREFVEQRFSWNAVGAQLQSLIQNLEAVQVGAL